MSEEALNPCIYSADRSEQYWLGGCGRRAHRFQGSELFAVESVCGGGARGGGFEERFPHPTPHPGPGEGLRRLRMVLKQPRSSCHLALHLQGNVSCLFFITSLLSHQPVLYWKQFHFQENLFCFSSLAVFPRPSPLLSPTRPSPSRPYYCMDSFPVREISSNMTLANTRLKKIKVWSVFAPDGEGNQKIFHPEAAFWDIDFNLFINKQKNREKNL